MTDIATIFDQAAEDIFDNMGADATFTPAAGDPVTLKVSVDRNVAIEGGDYDAQVYRRVTTLEYVKNDLGREAVPGETFTVASVVWTVESLFEDPRSNDGRFCKCIVR